MGDMVDASRRQLFTYAGIAAGATALASLPRKVKAGIPSPRDTKWVELPMENMNPTISGTELLNINKTMAECILQLQNEVKFLKDRLGI